VSKFQVKYESNKHSINIPVLVTITAAQLNTKDKIKWSLWQTLPFWSRN